MHHQLVRAFVVVAVGLLAPAPSGAGPATPQGNPAELFAAALAERDGSLRLTRLEAVVSAAPGNLRYSAAYRQELLKRKEYDRGIAFFTRLASAHPKDPHVALSYGYAYVDKLPDASFFSHLGLANKALAEFSRAVQLGPSWLTLYSRGNLNVYFPRMLGRTKNGIADLEKARELVRGETRRSYHALTWAALGDGHWRLGDTPRAREIWREGLALFPGDARLLARANKSDRDLDRYLGDLLTPGVRVSTDLVEVYREGWQEACSCPPDGE
ncbi:MAG TPA: tetratricopeptide repeat protein [Thermoanaerobaculia bacterium]|nr:tetratricopeptide repeat protein [Thermoanaerobaculia bacterium]